MTGEAIAKYHKLAQLHNMPLREFMEELAAKTVALP